MAKFAGKIQAVILCPGSGADSKPLVAAIAQEYEDFNFTWMTRAAKVDRKYIFCVNLVKSGEEATYDYIYRKFLKVVEEKRIRSLPPGPMSNDTSLNQPIFLSNPSMFTMYHFVAELCNLGYLTDTLTISRVSRVADMMATVGVLPVGASPGEVFDLQEEEEVGGRDVVEVEVLDEDDLAPADGDALEDVFEEESGADEAEGVVGDDGGLPAADLTLATTVFEGAGSGAAIPDLAVSIDPTDQINMDLGAEVDVLVEGFGDQAATDIMEHPVTGHLVRKAVSLATSVFPDQVAALKSQLEKVGKTLQLRELQLLEYNTASSESVVSGLTPLLKDNAAKQAKELKRLGDRLGRIEDALKSKDKVVQDQGLLLAGISESLEKNGFSAGSSCDVPKILKTLASRASTAPPTPPPTPRAPPTPSTPAMQPLVARRPLGGPAPGPRPGPRLLAPTLGLARTTRAMLRARGPGQPDLTPAAAARRRLLDTDLQGPAPKRRN